MLRASLTVHTLRWPWLALAVFVLPALLVALLPSAWMAVLVLLVLWGGFTLYHLPRSWAALQAQWHGDDVFSPKTKAMILSVMHHFEAMANKAHPHFPAMVEGLLTQVHEVEQDYAQAANRREHKAFDDFLRDFGRHFTPVFAALSFRTPVESLPPHTQWFFKSYQPVDTDTQCALNWISRYFDMAIADGVSDNLSILWLKSALLASDKKGKVSSDTLLDIHLTLLKRLLTQPELHQDVVEISLHAIFRLACEHDMNLFQQNSFAQVIETIIDRKDEGWMRQLATFNALYPKAIRHFQQQLIGIPEDKLEAYHASLMARNARVQSALHSLREFTSEQTENSADAWTELFLELGRLPPESLAMVIRHSADVAMVIALQKVDADTQAAFWRACAEIMHVDKLQAEYEQHNDKAEKSTWIEQAQALHHLNRVLFAVQALDRALKTQQQDEAQSNYINQSDRYEYDIEHRLNQAVYQKVDQVEAAMLRVLDGLRNDIESQKLQLDAFMQHLGRKFGGLINASQRIQSQEGFAWFLHASRAQCPDEPMGEPAPDIEQNTLLSLIHWQSEFRLGYAQNNPNRCFKAISTMSLNLLDQYPLHAELTHACLVTGMELIATQEIDLEHVSVYLPELYQALTQRSLVLHPETANSLIDLVQKSIRHFDLLENSKLTAEDKEVLGRLVAKNL